MRNATAPGAAVERPPRTPRAILEVALGRPFLTDSWGRGCLLLTEKRSESLQPLGIYDNEIVSPCYRPPSTSTRSFRAMSAADANAGRESRQRKNLASRPAFRRQDCENRRIEGLTPVLLPPDAEDCRRFGD